MDSYTWRNNIGLVRRVKCVYEKKGSDLLSRYRTTPSRVYNIYRRVFT